MQQNVEFPAGVLEVDVDREGAAHERALPLDGTDRLPEQDAQLFGLDGAPVPSMPIPAPDGAGEGLEQNFDLPEGVLEADVDKAEWPSRAPAMQHSASFERMEGLLEQNAKRLELEERSVPFSMLRAQEELERDAQRGLAAEIQREIIREVAAAAQDADGVPPSPAGHTNGGCGDAQPDDPYEHQLENEIEDHLCELRLQERQQLRAGNVPLEEPAVLSKDGKGQHAPAFIPPVRMLASDFDFKG